MGFPKIEVLGYFAVTKKKGEDPVLVVGDEETEKHRPIFDVDLMSKINGTDGDRIPLKCDGEVEDQGGSDSLELLDKWLESKGYFEDNAKPKVLMKCNTIKTNYINGNFQRLDSRICSVPIIDTRNGNWRIRNPDLAILITKNGLTISDEYSNISVTNRNMVFYVEREGEETRMNADVQRGRVAHERIKINSDNTKTVLLGASSYYRVVRHNFPHFELYASKEIDGFIEDDAAEFKSKRPFGLDRKKMSRTLNDLNVTKYISGIGRIILGVVEDNDVAQILMWEQSFSVFNEIQKSSLLKPFVAVFTHLVLSWDPIMDGTMNKWRCIDHELPNFKIQPLESATVEKTDVISKNETTHPAAYNDRMLTFDENKEITKMISALHDDSISNKIYYRTTALVFGAPLPQQPYLIDRSRFFNENGYLKATEMSETPQQKSRFPESIKKWYSVHNSPTFFASVPKRLDLRSTVVPRHKINPKTGRLGEFLLPSVRPLLEGDDKKVLSGEQSPTPPGKMPCTFCVGHSFLDICHAYPTILSRIMRLRNMNYTLYLAGRHQICPSCLIREYGHNLHEACNAKLGCSFCENNGHDSSICSSASHVSSLGDRWKSSHYSRSEVCEAILGIDQYLFELMEYERKKRRIEYLTRLAISVMMGLDVFKVGHQYVPQPEPPTNPYRMIEHLIFKPIPKEEAGKTAAQLAAARVEEPDEAVAETIAQQFEEAVPILPQQENDVQQDHLNDIVDVNGEHAENAAGQQVAEPEPAGEILPHQHHDVIDTEEIEVEQHQINHNVEQEVINEHGADAETTAQQFEEAVPILTQQENHVLQDLLNDIDDANEEQDETVVEIPEDQLDPTTPSIEDVFKEEEHEGDDGAGKY